MANLAMALDEIISKTKKMGSPRQVGGGGRRSAGRKIGGGGRGAAVEEPRTSARARFPQRGFVSGVRNHQIIIIIIKTKSIARINRQ
jgi:hypothetical protein